MQTFIVLFRGVNVGGNNLLPMKELVAQLQAAQFQDVAYYIQSGNVLLKCAADPTETLRQLVLQHFGFAPELFVMTCADFTAALAHNPFDEVDGKFNHIYFCHQPIELKQALLDKYRDPSEQYHVYGNVFYLYAPNGIGRSKLVANIEACLGQAATGRNLNTVNKLNSMLSATQK